MRLHAFGCSLCETATLRQKRTRKGRASKKQKFSTTLHPQSTAQYLSHMVEHTAAVRSTDAFKSGQASIARGDIHWANSTPLVV